MTGRAVLLGLVIVLFVGAVACTVPTHTAPSPGVSTSTEVTPSGTPAPHAGGAIAFISTRGAGLYVVNRDATGRYRLPNSGGVEALWDDVIAADPNGGGGGEVLSGDRLTTALETCAQFADIKCWFTRDHSPVVSSLARSAARSLGLDETQVQATAAAGLVQEMGKIGVANGILEAPNSLTPGQWDAVRPSTYYTQRILGRCQGLETVSGLASSHHERLNGSGYHRGVGADRIPAGARILAAADAYRAMTSDRPWRSRLAPNDAARTLAAEVKEGRLAHGAVDAVLSAVGQGALPRRQARPAGLSEREVDVLNLICLGKTNREVAQELFISAKTVGRHIEDIYAKTGVSTRPAATLFAMQNQLLS